MGVVDVDTNDEARNEAHQDAQGEAPEETSPPEAAAEKPSQPPADAPADAETPAPQPPEPEAPPEAPPQPQPEPQPQPGPAPPAPGGPSFVSRLGDFFKRIPADFRAARESASLGMALRSLERQKRDKADELTEACRALGAEAETAQVETDLDAFEQVNGSRQDVRMASSVLDEKKAKVAEAQAQLAQEETTHTERIAALEAEYQPLAHALAQAEAAVKTLEGNVRDTEGDIARLQTELDKARQAAAAPPPEAGEQGEAGGAAPSPPPPTRSPEDIQGEIGTAEGRKASLEAELATARQNRDEAKGAADDKGAILQGARDAWSKLGAELKEAVDEARKAQDGAQAKLAEAEKAIAEAHLEFGRAIFEKGSDAPGLAEPMTTARATADAIAAIDNETGQKAERKQQLQGGAKRFLLLAGGALLFVVLIVVLIIVIF